MFKKLLSLLSLTVLAATPMAVVSCSNDKSSYNLTENDMSIIANISENLNDFSIKKETLLKDVFTELDKQKEVIFNKFIDETKDNYTEKEFDKKKKEFDNLEMSIVYFNSKYDVVQEYAWQIYARIFNKNSEHFEEGNWPEWLNLSLEKFSIDRTIERWNINDFSEISIHMTIVLGDVNINSKQGDPTNAWVECIKVNTKFE